MWLWTSLVVVSAYLHPQTISDTKNTYCIYPNMRPLTLIHYSQWYRTLTDTMQAQQTTQTYYYKQTSILLDSIQDIKNTGWVCSSYNLTSSSNVFHVFMTQNLTPLFLLCNYFLFANTICLHDLIHFGLRYTLENWIYSTTWIEATTCNINNFDCICIIFNDIINVLTIF
jgi:hypothetical protein